MSFSEFYTSQLLCIIHIDFLRDSAVYETNIDALRVVVNRHISRGIPLPTQKKYKILATCLVVEEAITELRYTFSQIVKKKLSLVDINIIMYDYHQCSEIIYTPKSPLRFHQCGTHRIQ